MPNNLSIKTDYPHNSSVTTDYPKIGLVQPTTAQLVGTSTTYNDSTITYNSSSVKYGGHDGNDGPGPKMAKIIA